MGKEVLNAENIELNMDIKNKEEAIRYVGSILVDKGYVTPGYIEKMMERETLTSTYIGNNIAIPHGTEESKKDVLETGISLITVPGGVDFGEGDTAKVIIGIAGKDGEHLEVLSQIAIVCSEEENVEKIVKATSKEEILDLFSGVIE